MRWSTSLLRHLVELEPRDRPAWKLLGELLVPPPQLGTPTEKFQATSCKFKSEDSNATIESKDSRPNSPKACDILYPVAKLHPLRLTTKRLPSGVYTPNKRDVKRWRNLQTRVLSSLLGAVGLFIPRKSLAVSETVPLSDIIREHATTTPSYKPSQGRDSNVPRKPNPL